MSNLKNKRLKIILILSIILFSAGFFNSFCFAQDRLVLTVTPPLIKVNFNPGDIWSSSIKIVNNNPSNLQVYSSVMDFKSGKDGGVIFYFR